MTNYITMHYPGRKQVYLQIFVLQEVKGLTNKLYAYALARKKTCLHAKRQVHWCYG